MRVSRLSKLVKKGASGSDHFQTEPDAILPLLPYVRQGSRIWKPACGKGNLVRAFCGYGYDVIGTDREQIDFLEPDTLFSQLPGFDYIVTNPPFSIKDRFMTAACSLGKPFAFLLPLPGLEGSKRHRIYEQHGLELIIPDRRVLFETPSGKYGDGWFLTAWYCFGFGIGQQLTFVHLPKRKQNITTTGDGRA